MRIGRHAPHQRAIDRHTRWVKVGRPKGTQDNKQKVPPRHPYPPPTRGLDRPPRVAGIGTQKVLKTSSKKCLLGAHTHHPSEASIGPFGWQELAPKGYPKRQPKSPFRAPIPANHRGPQSPPMGGGFGRLSGAHFCHPQGLI